MVSRAHLPASAGTSVAAVAPEPITTDPAAESVHAGPLRRVALGVAVVALAHPEEFRREARALSRVAALGVDRPALVVARPARGKDPVAVADVAREPVLLDHLAHVLQDLLGRCDRCAGPGLEAVAEGVEVAVRADAREAVRAPGAAEVLLRLEHHERLARALPRQVVGAAHAGDPGADDQDVEVLGRRHVHADSL